MIPILDDQIPSAALHLWRLMAKYTGTSIQADVESVEACTKREAAAWAEEKTPHLRTLLDDSHPFCIVLGSGYFFQIRVSAFFYFSVRHRGYQHQGATHGRASSTSGFQLIRTSLNMERPTR